MFCPGCGRRGNEGEVYCGSCGRKLPWEKMESEKSAEPVENMVKEKTAEYAEDMFEESMPGNPEISDEEGAGERVNDANAQKEKVLESVAENPDGGPEEAGAERETFVLKKSTIKNFFFGVAGVVLAVIFLVYYLGSADIRNVKNGILEDYNYGVSIGDALHKWFDGTERWDSYSENGVTYITARGWTKYTVNKKTQEQVFLFHNLGGDVFSFDGIFDDEGDYLYLGNGNVDLLDLGDVISYGLYEKTLRAAFGDKEALQMFIEME